MPLTDDNAAAFWPETRLTYVGQLHSADPAARHQALARLCEIYRTPVLKRIRARWPLLSLEDAEDRCQQFFVDVILAVPGGGLFSGFDPSAGRLRTFLGVALQQFLIAMHRDATRQKRGGTTVIIPLDEVAENSAETPPDPQTPFLEFDRDWALHVFSESLRRIEAHWQRKPERAARYRVLLPWLTGDPPAGSLAAAAAALELDSNTLSQALRRLRRDWRVALEQIVAPTLAAPEDMDGELRYLLEILRQ